MKFDEFLSAKPLDLSDLDGRWVQRGLKTDDPNFGKAAADKLSWMRERTKDLVLPEDAILRFKREKVEAVQALGETMTVYQGDKILMRISSAACQLLRSEGAEAPKAPETAAEAVKQEAPKTDGRSAREIQEATPWQERHGWTNYALLDAINASFDKDPEEETKQDA